MTFKGEFLGFTYNGLHSSALGIVRTSNGSRFEENLLPTMQNKTVQIPGGDGTYYFGSYYTQKPIKISFAFDSLTETQLNNLRTHFGDKKIHELVLDETPYKAYHAKVTGTATIKYIPFDTVGEKGRIYKGEGDIQFTCYSPYAICTKKYLSDYPETLYPNRQEWLESSGIQDRGRHDILKLSEKGYVMHLYNPGVIESNVTIKIKTAGAKTCEFGIQNTDLGFVVDWTGLQEVPDYLIIDSSNNLVEGATMTDNKLKKNGQIYNEYITSGDFFKIPIGESILEISRETARIDEEDLIISYNYYYF